MLAEQNTEHTRMFVELGTFAAHSAPAARNLAREAILRTDEGVLRKRLVDGELGVVAVPRRSFEVDVKRPRQKISWT